MRIIIQRVLNASVFIEGKDEQKISKGLLIFVGFDIGDDESQLDYMAEKVVNLRIFEDTNKKFNLSALDIKADLMVISQFTLYADCRKGRRPSFTKAAPPKISEPLYDKFIERLGLFGLHLKEGQFGSHMDVSLINDGPVTILLDSKEMRRQ